MGETQACSLRLVSNFDWPSKRLSQKKWTARANQTRNANPAYIESGSVDWRQESSPEAEIRGAAYASEAEIRFLQSCLLLELRSQSENDGALAARPGKSRVAKEAVVWLPVLPGT